MRHAVRVVIDLIPNMLADPIHPLFDGLARAEFQSLCFVRGESGDDRQLDRLAIHVLEGEQNEAIDFWAMSVDEIATRAA